MGALEQRFVCAAVEESLTAAQQRSKLDGGKAPGAVRRQGFT